jgi:uncharacterized SAM-binding protein YcdF (DUF218 family)
MKVFSRALRRGAYAVLALILIVHFTPLVPWYARLLAGDWTDADGDILIVLGSEMERDGVLGHVSYRRAMYALRAQREHPFDVIILSGGTAPNAPMSVARAMGDFLAANGVPRGILHMEERSSSTRENALFTSELARHWPGKKVLLTSDIHMLRASRAFQKAGLPVIPRPLPDALKDSSHLIERWPLFWDAVIETGKLGYYAVRGWI